VQTGSSICRDIISAYLVTAARVLAWIVVTAAVFRIAGKEAFALLAIVQSTVGILEYAAIGLSPAIIRMTAEAMSESPAAGAVQAVYANGFAMALLSALGGGILLFGCLWLFQSSQTNADSHGAAFELILMFGVSTLVRLMSDAPGAALQTSGRISLDNLLLATHEVIWAAGTGIALVVLHLPWQRAAGGSLICASLILLIARGLLSQRYGSGLLDRWWGRLSPRVIRRLLIFGAMVVVAQMADYLYAPTDNLLILNLINQGTVAVYTPAVQIDSGALLLVGAIASVLLPRSALAHAAGDLPLVRRYYIRGTVATFFLLLVAAPILWFIAPYFFKLWLANPMPATCAILPLMLIHTIVGGSSAVGRSILLAIGKVRPFTVSVLIAGVANVVLSFAFVRYGHLGLRGIVLGTIVAVTGRCAIWMPWYTLRVLNREMPAIDLPILRSLPPAHLS
jgi:O-antigen/teichoic acid export membrane protein